MPHPTPTTEHPPPAEPAPAGDTRLVACEKCDSLFAYPHLAVGASAICVRCGFHIFTRRPNALQRAAAWSLAAAALFVVANFFPFLTVKVSGQHNSIILANSVYALIEHGSYGLASAVAIFILAAPVFLIGGLIYVLCPLLGARRLPASRTIARLIYGVTDWDMTEIFLLGVLVSLIKLYSIATVQIGISFYAFAAMILCITAAITSIGKYELWESLEDATG